MVSPSGATPNTKHKGTAESFSGSNKALLDIIQEQIDIERIDIKIETNVLKVTEGVRHTSYALF